MMKLLVVCPSNRNYMPYLDNYIRVLENEELEIEYVVWDRMKKNEQANFIYIDKKKSFKRGFLDYIKFTNYVKKVIKNNDYDFVIVFSIQLMFFINKLLIKKFDNRFIFDIRDYHNLVKLMDMDKIIKHSYMTVVSSEAFKRWLPNREKIILNHNTNVSEIKSNINETLNAPIVIGTIGALRDYKINKELIGCLGNNDSFQLVFDGNGIAKSSLEEYSKENKYTNVVFTGEYKKCLKAEMYSTKDIISVLRYNDGINNNTALPNRLYDSILYGKPLIALKGTYLAEIIETYNLGVCIEDLKEVEVKLKKYCKNFNAGEFNKSRTRFFSIIVKQNMIFEQKLITLVRGES